MNRFLLTLLFTLYISSFGFSQSRAEILRSYFKEEVALKNSILINGIEPIDSKIVKNGSGKYLRSQFETGTITYNNHYFENVQLKYNVYDDFVLANISQNEREKFFQLIPERLTKFSIGNNNFEYVEYKPQIFGYLEVIFQNEVFALYKKYLKDELERSDKTYVYYEYISQDSEFYFEFNSKIHLIKNKQDLIEVWPTRKKWIKAYFRNNKSHKGTEDFYTKVLLSLTNSDQ